MGSVEHRMRMVDNEQLEIRIIVGKPLDSAGLKHAVLGQGPRTTDGVCRGQEERVQRAEQTNRAARPPHSSLTRKSGKMCRANHLPRSNAKDHHREHGGWDKGMQDMILLWSPLASRRVWQDWKQQGLSSLCGSKQVKLDHRPTAPDSTCGNPAE